MQISCGVPQGSVLDPVLFLVYINDRCNAAPEVKLKLSADDTSLFIHSCNEQILCQNANK
jgi:hypothetical protein